MSHLTEVEAKRSDGAHYYNGNFKMPNYNIMSNYFSTIRAIEYITRRSYEKPFKWYFLTFKPFNSTYHDNYGWYQNKCLDHCRKKLGKVEAYIMSRETEATKTHVNILCVTSRDLEQELMDKKTNRYYIYCKESICRHDCLRYIFKESKSRNFKQYKDYVFHSK